MTAPGFIWDSKKEGANFRKHGVPFAEAQTVFSDEAALLLDDPGHSDTTEERFVLLGVSARMRMLVVVHCYREANDLIRIISARKATQPERRQYEQRRRQ